MAGLLVSEHFQVALKTCAFLYNHEAFFHGPLRVKLMDEIIFKAPLPRLIMPPAILWACSVHAGPQP